MANLKKSIVIKLAESVGKFLQELPKLENHTFPEDEIGIGAVLDTETTDIKLPVVEVTEIAIRKFRYHKPTRTYIEPLDYIDLLNEPSNPELLTPEIQELTGLTMEKLKGHKIDIKVVEDFISDVDFLIAHNSAFDKDKVEVVLQVKTNGKKWHCSQRQIDWTGKHGMVAAGMEIIALHLGFDYEGHRAINDVDALLQMIVRANVLSEMLENADTCTVKISGYLDQRNSDGSTPVKDGIKNRENETGYWFGFNFDQKFWYNERVAGKDVQKVKTYIEGLLQKHNPTGKVTIEVTVNK